MVPSWMILDAGAKKVLMDVVSRSGQSRARIARTTY
jgi:hypothetical protein